MNSSVLSDKLIPSLQTIHDHVETQWPSAQKTLRAAAWDRFVSGGLPNTKNENWKYTSLESLSMQSLRQPKTSSISDLPESLQGYLDTQDINLVFIDGYFAPHLSTEAPWPQGLVIQSLKNNTAKDRQLTMECGNVFASLNDALFDDGVLITVKKAAMIHPLIHVLYLTTGTESAYISPRVNIHGAELSAARVLLSYISLSPTAVYFNNSLSDIQLEEGANLNFSIAQNDSLEAFHINNTSAVLAKDACFNIFSFVSGSQLTRHDLSVSLQGPRATAILNGLSAIRGSQHVDHNTVVDHIAPNTTSQQLYKGILKQSSRSVFNGKIFVHPEAQQTAAYQLNKNLLMGKDCRVDTKPQLEIFADDVKCSHGATIGQLNEDEVFYLQTRCIDKTTAIKMLAQGFVDDLLGRIDDDRIVKKLCQFLIPVMTESLEVV